MNDNHWVPEIDLITFFNRKIYVAFIDASLY